MLPAEKLPAMPIASASSFADSRIRRPTAAAAPKTPHTAVGW
jgi:hypothetical protein